MACFRPLKGFRGINGGISWTPAVSFVDVPMEVPCGQCIGCRLERSRQWAVRLMHESQSCGGEASFITLTYDEAHLPADGSLVKSDFQKFIKRLRKSVSPKRVSYFHCGEYGDANGRPHYHACIFNHVFDRLGVVGRNHRDECVYESAELARLWPLGFSSTGDLTFESAAYVARYVLKKVTGDMAHEHYRRVSLETGECVWLQPEYCTMSLKPGIGQAWFDSFQGDIEAYDGVVVAGQLGRVPRYYDKLRDREVLRRVKRKRERVAFKRLADQTPERLAVREEVCRSRVGLFLKRGL